MPFGEYENFDDCLSKNSDKDDPSAYCGYIKNKVEEALLHKEAKEAIKAVEQDPNEPEGLTTPDAEDQNEEEVQSLTSPQGSSREAQNDQASGDGETSPADPPQDQAEPQTNPEDQAKPENVTTTEVSPDSEIKTNDKYGELNGDKYEKNEQDQKDEKREEQQGLEYNGETYHKVKAIEYDDEIYIQKDDKEEAEEDDIEFEEDVYKKADEDTLELENDNDYFVKDNEQAPIGGDISMPTPTTAIDTPSLNPMGESVIIRESNGKYRKYNVFQAKEQEEDFPLESASDRDVDEMERNKKKKFYGDVPRPSEEVRAVEKIIIKEKGKLKFKSVFTEVKKKA